MNACGACGARYNRNGFPLDVVFKKLVASRESTSVW
jgi:hypothetical protein